MFEESGREFENIYDFGFRNCDFGIVISELMDLGFRNCDFGFIKSEFQNPNSEMR